MKKHINLKIFNKKWVFDSKLKYLEAMKNIFHIVLYWNTVLVSNPVFLNQLLDLNFQIKSSSSFLELEYLIPVLAYEVDSHNLENYSKVLEEIRFRIEEYLLSEENARFNKIQAVPRFAEIQKK